jgi:hypothetical protein
MIRWIAGLEATRPHVGGSGKYLVLILLASKRYMIVSFIETTDLTPKQYPNRINLSYLFPNRPNQSNQIGLCTIHVVLYTYYSTAWALDWLHLP